MFFISMLDSNSSIKEIIFQLSFLLHGSVEKRRNIMANYKGLDCVMGEITHMACAAKDSIHEQHVYDYFTATENSSALLFRNL